MFKNLQRRKNIDERGVKRNRTNISNGRCIQVEIEVDQQQRDQGQRGAEKGKHDKIYYDRGKGI